MKFEWATEAHTQSSVDEMREVACHGLRLVLGS
jgi:hypothetical protein